MQERLPLGNKYVLDVNSVAIYLVENHPGNEYLSTTIDKLIENGSELVIFDFLPFRVLWIMTSKWKIDRKEASLAILSFLGLPNVRIMSLDKSDIHRAFELARDLRHDVYDVVYVVLALKARADGIITTDTDFERICDKLNLEYVNPVPRDVLRQFCGYK